jgi:hypothetical protein
MIGRFNIMCLGRHDQILLGIPWLHAMDPMIQWKAGTLSLPRTPKSDLIEEDVNNKWKKNKLPPLFSKKQKYEHSQLLKELVKPERVDSTAPFTAKIKEIPDKETFIPTQTAPIFDTKEDIWDNYKPMITDITTYQLCDEDASYRECVL